MRRVAIYGGSFNPPHVAHQMACLYVLETAPVDALWVVPTFAHPFAKELLSFEHRFAMCERAFAGLGDRIRVSNIEQQMARASSRTLDTLEELTKRYGDTTFRLVVGADILGERDKWYRWSDVAELAPPIVVGRRGYPGPAEFELPEVSSTDVRARLLAGQDASALVPASVMDYIAQHGLYR